MVNIHGKQYITVAERVQELHDDKDNFKDGAKIEINTEVLYTSPVVVKATVKTSKGIFTGISAANPTKTLEKQSPYEIAETSAVGRALGFAGYGVVEGIATADEMNKAENQNGTDEGSVPVKAFPINSDSNTKFCSVHGEEMQRRISKSGKPFYSHIVNGKHCFGN